MEDSRPAKAQTPSQTGLIRPTTPERRQSSPFTLSGHKVPEFGNGESRKRYVFLLAISIESLQSAAFAIQRKGNDIILPISCPSFCGYSTLSSTKICWVNALRKSFFKLTRNPVPKVAKTSESTSSAMINNNSSRIVSETQECRLSVEAL